MGKRDQGRCTERDCMLSIDQMTPLNVYMNSTISDGVIFSLQGFSNTLWLVILVLVAPMAMRSTDKEDVFLCVFMFVMSLAFPVLGYVVTWDQP